MADPTKRGCWTGFYRRFWYVPDSIAVAFVFLYLLFMNAAPGNYIGGLHNDGAWAFGVTVGYGCFLMPVAFLCTLAVAVRMSVSWPRHILARRRLLTLRLFVGLALSAGFIFFFTPLRPMGHVVYTYGFREYVRNNVDIPAIRNWLSTLDPNACTGEPIYLRDATSTGNTALSGAVTSLNPDNVALRCDEHGCPAACLAWCGFDAGWGVTIGDEDMKTPATRPRRKVKVGGSMVYENGVYRLPVEPGVYVWHTIQ